MNQIVEKYDVPGPRYTSYPTVPFWNNDSFTASKWKKNLIQSFNDTNDTQGISLYIHLPYCESLCTFCGCNRRITVNHGVELPYIKAVLKEWNMYLNILSAKPKIRELHLGGGTPTFFSPNNLKTLINGILDGAELCDDFDFGFEGHPNNTTSEHLQALYDLGFRRVSFGVQDFDDKVQFIIHRMQTYEAVKEVTEAARTIGYTSINYDLVYGLPLQTLETITDTVEKTKELKPDRIAFYSYAHVPWIKPGQRRFTEADLPKGYDKRILYETGRVLLERAGYIETGMDHFALETDPLYIATQAGDLHRNFMGYTTQHTKVLIGLGVSSISDVWSAFAQNEKEVEPYLEAINAGRLPLIKGHILSDEDLVLRKHIMNIMCRMQTTWNQKEDQCSALYNGIDRMKELEEDGLVKIEPYKLTVTEVGKSFLRNICMALDAYLTDDIMGDRLFSKTV